MLPIPMRPCRLGGKLLATRQLVALNAPGNVGTAVSPVDVLVDRDEPVIVASLV